MGSEHTSRVLYIEDETPLGELFATVISGIGFHVDVAATGEEGLKLFKADPYDVVAVDYMLPDTTGLELARKLLELEPELPIVFVTGSGSEQVAAHAMALGVMHYVIKDDTQTYLRLLPEIIENLNNQRKQKVASQKLFQAIFENSTEGMVVIDEEGIVQVFNPAAETLFGYTSDEIVGQNVSILMPQEDRAEHEDRVRRSDLKLRRYIHQARDLTAQHKDGSTFPIELNISPMVVDGHKRVVGIFRDITERKAMECKLRMSEERLSSSLRFANIGSWDWNIETGDLYWTESIGTLFGYPPGELETSYDNFVAAIHPDDREAVTSAVTACVETGAEYNIQHRVVWPDGTVRWLHERGDVLRNENGKPMRMLGVVSDITAKKVADEELAQAKEDAETANTAKSEFLSSMSHELRTPLNAILGFAQLLENDPRAPLSDDQKDYMQHVIKGGNHLLELINEVLDLAKIEAGKLTLSLESIDTGQLIDECLNFATTLAEKRSITIHDQVQRNVAHVWADHLRTKQALLNLLSNAVKYNREGGEITIATKLVNGSMLRISVSDTGDGIAEERMEELFQPFNRLGADASEIEGTGIGLTLTKKIVEEMSGSIGVKSTMGEGSTFWLDLPVSELAVVKQVLEDQGDVSFDLHLKDGARKLLYVEDNPANLALMEGIMSRIDHLDMISTHTAELGLAMAEEHHPDVIVLDVNLPGMNGIEAVKTLKTNEATKDIPVIALSANAMPKTIDEGIRAGFDAYLTKPVVLKDLMDALDTALHPA